MADKKIVELINKDFSYPDIDDKSLQQKLYEKREFHYYRLPENNDIEDPEEIKRYRTQKCSGKLVLQEHQNLLSNFINPNTPYKGVLVFHGVGTGKCVHGSTDIYINNTKLKICQLWDTHIITIIKDRDGGEWGVPKSSYMTLSYDSTKGHIIKENISKFYREKISEVIRKIILENGVTITTTYKHSFIVNGKWSNIINLDDTILYYTGNSIQYCKVVDIISFSFTGYFYDLETETTHTYLANNIISHNTCAAISIAEKFKEQVQRYGTKIYVLLPGPLLKEQWKRELIKCTGNTYITDPNVTDIEIDKDKQRKDALNIALQYYKFISYKGFYKRVLGEKIYIKKDGKKEFERDIPSNRIVNLNNSLIIAEEAHNLTGNDYGTALQHIIDNSINLKVVLLTATPMKNLGDDVVDLINFLRPDDSKIIRNKVFTSDKNHLMKFEKGGEEYLKNMCRGYVSYLKGGNVLTYASKNDIGEIPDGLLFTKVIKCYMKPFQLNTYQISLQEEEDALDRKSEAIANFVFPGLDENKNLTGYYGIEGRTKVINQLKLDSKNINHKICDMLKIKHNEDMIYLSNDDKIISGNFLKVDYIQHFSTKFYDCLLRLNDLVFHKRGARTAFIYSNLVRIGIELFQEILLKNGYYEYNESRNYPLHDDSRCYFCGMTYKDHTQGVVEKNKNIPTHSFYQATFVTVTGKSDDGENVIPEEKQRILDDVFSNIENKNGKFIKFVIGSKVMNEGISLKNVAEVHVLDVYYNLGRIEQVVGRAIRHCSHYSMMMEGDMYPEVSVYKYCITLDGEEMSSEELLYKKAEQKYLLIKKVERYLKEVAIDCPLNISANVSKSLIKKHANCAEPGEKGTLCPEICDFTTCDYKCYDQVLNNKYYDPNRKIYKIISKQQLDYSTFTGNLARSEIDNIKNIIKKLYKIKHIYNLNEIINFVKKMYDKSKIDLYDDYFVFKALDELIPITLNDINNFKDYIRDKYNINGYIIAIKDNYIFQPLDQPKNLSIYYRTIYNKKLSTTIPLSNYIKDKYIDEDPDDYDTKEEDIVYKDKSYNLDYYDSRPEYDVIGIIEKYKGKDNFKIRDKRAKNLDKKRATGIPSLTGAVCTTKDKDYVTKIAKKLGITYNIDDKRIDICNKIRDKLLLLEKYSTGKDKRTYMMVPINHNIYQFPYNLEDRGQYIKEIITSINTKINVIIQKKDKSRRIDIFISKVPPDNVNDVLNKLNIYNIRKKGNEFFIQIE